MRGAVAPFAPSLAAFAPSLASFPGQTIPLLALRGGEADIGRLKVRLESHGQYAVVAALLMNAALRLFSDNPTFHHCTLVPRWVQESLRYLFIACTMVSVIGGLHAAVVFALIGMYAKSALGLGLDAECDTFLRATHVFRKSGYESFVGALLGFTTAFILALLNKLKMEDDVAALRVAVVAVGVGASIWSVSHYLRILGLASRLIFAPRLSAGL